jgi:hypothetical protein
VFFVISQQHVMTDNNSSLLGLTRQSIHFVKNPFRQESCEKGWMPGSSPGMTTEPGEVDPTLDLTIMS